MTARDHVDAESVFIFAWGYWYAWTLSIFALALCLSSAVPSTLPCVALFFTCQHCVDKYNLTHWVYAAGNESENMYSVRALHLMRCIIAFWWILMGFSLMLSAPHIYGFSHPLRIKLLVVSTITLIFFAVVLIVVSWLNLHTILHVTQFERVDLKHMGLAGPGICKTAVDKANGILNFLCCRHGLKEAHLLPETSFCNVKYRARSEDSFEMDGVPKFGRTRVETESLILWEQRDLSAPEGLDGRALPSLSWDASEALRHMDEESEPL